MLRHQSKPKPLMLLSMAVVLAVGGIPGFAIARPPLHISQSSRPGNSPNSQLSQEQQTSLEEAKRLSQQAVELYNKGQYDAAVPLAERALAIREKVLGAEHPDVATSLNNLAVLYQKQGNYQQAESLLRRSLAINEKVLGAEHPDVAKSLNNLATIYLYQGNYQQAEPLYKRSLALYKKIRGVEHPDIAPALANLASLYQNQGNYQQAETFYKRSLAIREKELGVEHPEVAISLNNLASLYQDQGKYKQAESLLKRSLAINEKVLGAKHPLVAIALNNLAGLYLNQGNYQQAEPLLKRSLAIREKVGGVKHPEVAISLNNLASLYKYQGKYQQAEPLLKRSLAIREKVLGAEHPSVATALNNLADLYQDQGNYQQAETLYKRSLAIFEKVLGAEHPDVASSLNNLALLYLDLENYQQAELLFKRSLAIRKKVLGAEHPSVASSLNNLSGLYLEQGNISDAIDFLQRGLETQEKNLELIFVLGAEQRKQSYMSTFTNTTYSTISLALQFTRNNPTADKLALTTVFRRKGRVLDAVADSIQILRAQLPNKPELKQLFDQWTSTLQQQSALVYGEKTTPQLYRERFSQLEATRQKLEEKISTQSAEFRNAIQPVELAAIQAKIPKDAAMVEIVQYQPFNAKAKNTKQWGSPRYAAAVVRSHGVPKWIDLGEASQINKTVASLRVALSREQGKRSIPNEPKENAPSWQQPARTLYKQVMEPIRTLLGDAKHIIISPDGQLSLIPFEALMDEKNQYLIQRYAFSYLTTGRDLLRFPSTVNNNSAPVVFADIDYDKQKTIATAPKSATRGGSTHRRSNDLTSGMRFEKLENTLLEAEEIKAIFPVTTIIRGNSATETAIKQLSAPSILHLATHGFFLTDQQIKPKFNNFDLQQPPTIIGENPLLRSGLALAGFNSRNQSSSADDGVLTSLEVAGLNLRGTQLVVLSACETGLGDISVGDGLYGLRRALVIAGSQSQVLSLWKVDDAATKDLMVNYYQKLKAGKGRHEALRQAQLEMLKTSNYHQPKYWASFVASGDWTPLQKSQLNSGG